MDRLTEIYFDEFGIKHARLKNDIPQKTHRSYTWTPQEIANEKLAELEDFMEEHKCHSVGDLILEFTISAVDKLNLKLTEEKLDEMKAKLAESKEQLIAMNEKSNKIKKESYHFKQQLKESEKFMQANGFKSWKEAQDALNGKFECIFDEKQELWKKIVAENAQLKQQLAEKDKEVQKWKNKKVKYIVDNIICDRNQTAIDELEKVRSKIARLDVSPDESNRLIPALDNYTNGFHKSRFKIVNILDQQIKSLKGEK